MHLVLNKPQGRFLSANRKFNAFVGGYRSGKTFVGCVRLWMLAAQYPGIKLGYFAPTYPMIQDIFYSTITEVGEMLSLEWGVSLTVDINVSRKEVRLFVDGVEYSMVKCRAMEHAHRIVGFDISHAQIDEIDTMKRDKADAAWKKIIARMSSKRPDYPVNTVDFTTTPEGFNFVHDLFVVQAQDNPALARHYSLTQASTRENAKNLPDDYIQSLYDTYPSQLVDAYVDGEFVNLTSGTVYHNYNRERCRSTEKIIDGEPLLIGQDFNVGKMASTVYVKRSNGWHAVAELCDLFDTPDVIRVIEDRWKNQGHRIIMYPDASGKNRKSNNASTSDIALMEQAGFDVRVNASNPAVKDRVLSMNKALECGKIWINDSACPNTARGLEQQAYDKNGEPDKSGNVDHQCFHGDQIVVINGVGTRFRDIPKHGLVLCPDGFSREYVNGGLIKKDQRMLAITLSNGKVITCTEDHGFMTDIGMVMAKDIKGRLLCDHASFLKANKNTMGLTTTCAANTSSEMVSDFTESFSKVATGLYRKGFTSIISMVTGLTITQRILSCYQQASTRTTITTVMEGQCREQQLKPQKSGTLVMMGLIGTRLNTRVQSTCSTLTGSLHAFSAGASTQQEKLEQISIAATIAQLKQGGSQALTMRNELARNVELYLSRISTKKQGFAAESALEVIAVNYVGASDAYCLTVPSIGCFSVCGVATSNCDATTYPVVYEMPVLKPIAHINVKMW